MHKMNVLFSNTLDCSKKLLTNMKFVKIHKEHILHLTPSPPLPPPPTVKGVFLKCKIYSAVVVFLYALHIQL